MIKAIIFDLDGVLSDTEKTRFELLKSLVKKRGLILNNNEYPNCIGKRTTFFLKNVFGDKLSDEEIDKIFIERKKEYHKNPKKYILSQPHAYECCKILSKAGYTLAIASASEVKDIKLVLSEINLLKFFKLIVGFDMIKKTKPNPETYTSCCNKLGLSNSECVAIEDSPVGVKSATKAGVFCVAVTYTHDKKELFEANTIINSLNQLTPKFINNLDKI